MLKFENLPIQDHAIPEGQFHRAKIAGGWLVAWTGINRGTGGPSGLTFVYDPEHQWDGSSLPDEDEQH